MEGLCSQQERRGSTLASPLGKKPLESQLGKQEEFQAYGKSEDISVLHKDIRDLKAQLQTANKIIQNLKSRVRSLSVTSDYSSSLERPRKLKAIGTLIQLMIRLEICRRGHMEATCIFFQHPQN